MKQENKISFVVTILLTILSLVASIIVYVSTKSPIILVSVLELFLLMMYGVYTYAVPHGNLLRYVFMTFGIVLAVEMNNAIALENQGLGIILIAALMIVMFVSGRLHKLNQNKVLLSVVLALLVAYSVVYCFAVSEVDVFKIVTAIINPLIFVVLCGTYFMRFNEHKEAGKEENK